MASIASKRKGTKNQKLGHTNEHVGPKILAKIKIYVLTRAELLFPLCYEIPCIYANIELVCESIILALSFHRVG